MNWDTFDKVCRAIYGFGLLLVGGAFYVAFARFGPPAMRIFAGLADALRLASSALTASTVSQQSISAMAQKIDDIHAAIKKVQ